jgi:WD40 repeat protein
MHERGENMIPSFIRARACALWMLLGLVAAFPTGAQTAATEKPEIFVQLGHTAKVTCMAVSPDRYYVLSGSQDKTAKLWELATGKEIRTFPQEAEVYAVDISPDGSLGLVSCPNKPITLYSLQTGELLRHIGPGVATARACAFLPGGKELIGMDSAHRLTVWDVETGAITKVFEEHHEGLLCSFALSPDGRWAATSGFKASDGVYIWDIFKGRLVRRLDVPLTNVNLSFSPDSRTLMTSGVSPSEAGQAILWSVSDGHMIWRTVGGKLDKYVWSSTFNPNGDCIILSQGQSKPPIILNAKSGTYVGPLNIEKYWWLDTFFTYSKDGTILLSTLGKSILVTRLKENITYELGGDATPVYTISTHPSTGQLLIERLRAPMELWNLQQGTCVSRLESETAGVAPAQSTADGRRIFAIDWKNPTNMTIWDQVTYKILGTFPSDHTQEIESIAISPDGRWAATSSDVPRLKDPGIRIWDVTQGKVINVIKNLKAHSMAFSRDGRFLFVSCWDSRNEKQSIKMFELKRSRPLWEYQYTESKCVAFSPDGTTCISSGELDRTSDEWLQIIVAHDLRTGAVLHKTEMSVEMNVDRLCFSPDGKTLLVKILGENGMRLLDAATFKEIKRFEGYRDQVEDVAFSPDGRQALMGSWGGVVRVWDIASGRELVALIGFTDGEWITVTPEGYYDASSKGDAHLNVRLGNRVVGIEAYRESLYRPDLVKAALRGESLTEYRPIQQILPAPMVSFAQMPTQVDQDSLEVKVRLVDQGGGLGDVRLFLNGTAVKVDQARGLKVIPAQDGGVLRTYTVHLMEGANTLQAVAFNADNTMQAQSELLQVHAVFTRTRKPSLYALVVGIQSFRNPRLDLQFTVADANLFADTLQRVASRVFENVKVKRLVTREETTRENLQAAFKAFQSLNPEDTFLFFVASHGTVDDGEYFLLTSNVGATSTQKLRTDALSQADLKALIANVPCTKRLVFLDTCGAGAMGTELQQTLLTRGMSEETAMKVLSRAVGSTVLCASTSAQEALEGYEGHGLFTYVLVEGLKGKAARTPGDFIRTTELASYVEDQVPFLAEKVFKRAQFPTINISGQSFPIGKGD